MVKPQFIPPPMLPPLLCVPGIILGLSGGARHHCGGQNSKGKYEVLYSQLQFKGTIKSNNIAVRYLFVEQWRITSKSAKLPG